MKLKELLIFRNLYLVGLFALVLLIIFTPQIIRDGFSIFEEEVLEVIVIVFLFAVGLYVYYLYEKELAEQSDTIEENWKHIGRINLQVERFKESILELNKYPENRSDFKKLLYIIIEKIIAMNNSQFVLLRIIDVVSLKTLAEDYINRNSNRGEIIKISNRSLANGDRQSDQGMVMISSSIENLNIQSFCIMKKS